MRVVLVENTVSEKIAEEASLGPEYNPETVTYYHISKQKWAGEIERSRGVTGKMGPGVVV